MGGSSTEGNVTVSAMESVMRNMNPSSKSSSSTALSVTAAIGGLLVLLTLLVGGPIACVCFVAMYVKKLRKRAKHARSLVFASQWRSQNPLLPFPHALQHVDQCSQKRGGGGGEEEEEKGETEAKAETEKGIIFSWPYFLYTEIPTDFNGLSTAFFQSPPPIIFQTCGGLTPELIRFNPGIGLKRQEQSVQCSHPLLAGSILPSASSFTYFEVTIIGFNKEKSSGGMLPLMMETKGATNGEDLEGKTKTESITAFCLGETAKELSSDKSLTAVYSSECIQIHEESWAPPPFDQIKREVFETCSKANEFQSIITATDFQEHQIEVITQGKALMQVVIEGTLAVGLAARPAPPFRLPGRDAISVALHSKSGRLFTNNLQEGEPFAAPPSWGKVGATVGCGYDMATHTVCFTIEGVCYNTSFNGTCNASISDGDDDDEQTAGGNETKFPLFPTIGADCDVSVRVNLGQESFKFMPGSCSYLQQ